MSQEELGRPTYTARAATPRAVEPPQFHDEPPQANVGGRRRRGRAAPDPITLPPEPAVRQAPPRGRAPKPAKPSKPQEPTVARKKAKKQEPAAAEDARTVYVPVVVSQHGVGYGLWRVVRFIASAVVWLIRTMIKVALSAFVHA